MRNNCLYFAVPIGVALLTAWATAAGADDKPLVFTDITVIDATGGPARPHMMVTISGGKIAAIQGYRQARVPKGAEVVDGRGKFLIPGLWDMHAHPPNAEGYTPLFIANGVTGIRVMTGYPLVHQRQKAIENGSLIGPRMVISSLFLSSGTGGPAQGQARDAAEGRQAVHEAKKQGADFLKIGTVLSRDAYFAIADEAKKEKIPFAGHIPLAVRLTEASDAGQKSEEHLMGFVFEASSREEQIREQCNRNPDAEYCSRETSNTFDPGRAAAIYRRLIRNHTWEVPTLVTGRNSLLDLTNDPHLKYVDPETRNQWNASRDSLMKRRTAAQWEDSKRIYQHAVKIVGDMHRAGVPLLAGTDIMNPFLVPGFSLHDELAIFVEAGLTPMEALQTATRNAAEYFGTLKFEGTIETGKRADLVMLDANPLTDIRNTQKISGVMLGGRYFDRVALDKMLADVEALANPK